MTNDYPSNLIYIEAEGDLSAVTPVHEGAKDGDGATGISLQIETMIRTRNAVLMLASLRSVEDWEIFLWDDNKKSLYTFGVTGITSKHKFGEKGGCYLVTPDFSTGKQEIEAAMKKIKLTPTSVPGCWDAVVSIYIRNPPDQFIADCTHALKSRITFQFIQKQEEIEPDKEELE